MPIKREDPDKDEKKSTNWTVAKEHADIDKFYLKRKEELIQSRKNIKGKDLDKFFGEVEANYQPHRVKVDSPRKIDNSQPNLYIKVSTALSIVLNTQFDASFHPENETFKKTNAFIRGVYLHSLDPQVSSTRQQYFNTGFNLAMFGSAGMRTYRRLRTREIYSPDGKTKRRVTDIDEIDAQSMHPSTYWLDDMARPGDRWSHTDWLRREVYAWRTFKNQFRVEAFPDVEYVQRGGDTALHLNTSIQGQTEVIPDKVEVFFYENEMLDLYIIEANNIRFNISPLPTTNKRLTLSHGIWSLRSTDSAYGIGIWEVIEQDQQLIDMVKDMSVEQLVLSIFSIIFHDGTNKIDEDKLKIEAGKWFKMLNPDKIKQFQLNPPGKESIDFIEKFQKDMDDASGISKILSGEQLGKTAFEANLNQEAGLRRLKTPANNLKELFEWEAANRVDMIQQVYSMPRVRQLFTPEEIDEYTKEISTNGTPDEEQFFVDKENRMFAKEFRQIPLNLEEDKSGSFVPSKKTNFFRATPSRMEWKGKIKIKVNSLLVSSETLEKQNSLDLSKELGNYIMAISQTPGIAPYLVPQMKQIVLAYKQDPEDWIPQQALVAYKDALAELEEKEEMKKQMAEAPQGGEQPQGGQGGQSIPVPQERRGEQSPGVGGIGDRKPPITPTPRLAPTQKSKEIFRK